MGRKRKEEHFVEHELLDDKCRKYIEDAINSYHQIGSEFLLHSDFLQFWYNHIWEKPTPQNALLGAIRFFDEKKSLSKISKKYFEKIRKHYNCVCDITKPSNISKEEWENSDKIKRFNEGKETLQWIKKLLSQNPPEEVRTNVEWLPNLVNDSWTDCEKVIASEISFGWKMARLWQLLKSRTKEYYIKSFLGMDVKESESNSEILPGSIVVPVELTESLKNIDAEKIDFFEKYLHFFSPTYLSSRELCNFWKKACISSIEGRSVKSAYRQPIDKIWLLARFFNVHFYSLDFVQSSRGLPSRLVKQIESLKNPSVLQNIMKEKIEHLLKSDQVPRWGGKGLPVEEIFATLASDNDFKDLQKKANEIYPEFQENPAKEVYEKAVPLKTSGWLLNKISFLSKRTDSDQVKEAKAKILEFFKAKQSNYRCFFLLLSCIDYISMQFDNVNESKNDVDVLDDFDEDEDCIENGKESQRKTNNSGQIGFGFMWVSCILSWSVKHEKNFVLMSSEDIDEETWKMIMLILTFVTLFFAIKALQESSFISVSNSGNAQTL